MTFSATLAPVPGQGPPPVDFLVSLVSWGRIAPDEVFLENDNYDIYSIIEPVLGPWTGLPHRRAAMLEVLRVLGGLESSWNWQEGADPNGVGEEDPVDQETGIFQVSANSMGFDQSLSDVVLAQAGATDAATFIAAMKSNRELALEYCARLLRFNVSWDGPISRGILASDESRAAVAEFEALLTQPPPATQS
jgi:hypothetical protein